MPLDVIPKHDAGWRVRVRETGREVLTGWLPAGLLYVAFFWVLDAHMRTVRAVALPIVIFVAGGCLRGASRGLVSRWTNPDRGRRPGAPPLYPKNR